MRCDPLPRCSPHALHRRLLTPHRDLRADSEDDDYDARLSQPAVDLYGMVHARYLLTARGLDIMVRAAARRTGLRHCSRVGFGAAPARGSAGGAGPF